MKERIFTTKEQGRVLVEAGLPISTAIGFRDKYLDQLHSMEDDAGRIGLIEAVTPDISNPVWDVGTLLNLLPYEIEGSKRSDGLRLLSIVEFQTTLVLSPVPFQRTVLVNISYQFL